MPEVKDMIVDLDTKDGKDLQVVKFKRHEFNGMMMAYIRGVKQHLFKDRYP